MTKEQAAESTEVNSVEATVAEKLHRIIIPRLDFEETSLEEAIDFLRLRLSEVDYTESDPTKRGMSFVIRRVFSGS